MNNLINETVIELESKLIATRRWLHAHPELSFNEKNTMNYICKFLDELGVEYISGISGTGVMATICGEKPSESPKNILIRADIDALPVTEETDVQYISETPGVMHACGHDAHTATALLLCEALHKLKSEFCGCVKIVFQPGEETSGGAEPMINSGILLNPNIDMCFALHVDPDIESGKIRIKPGSLYASPDDFKIIVKGRGGHGAEPHNCINPIVVSAEIVSALSSLVSREIDPFEKAVVSVCCINAGTASNIIPENAEIIGTARSLNNVRSTLKNRIGETAKGICAGYGAECEYEFTELFPPLINNENLSDKLYKIAADTLGEENCIYGGLPTMAGEDFAYFSQQVPSVLFKLGCRNEEENIVMPLHHNKFNIDEKCLKTGLTLFIAAILKLSV